MSESEIKKWKDRFLRKHSGDAPEPEEEAGWTKEYLALESGDRDAVNEIMKESKAVPDKDAEAKPPAFPAGWCEEVLARIKESVESGGNVPEALAGDARAASFLQISRIVKGWNSTVAEIPRRSGSRTRCAPRSCKSKSRRGKPPRPWPSRTSGS